MAMIPKKKVSFCEKGILHAFDVSEPPARMLCCSVNGQLQERSTPNATSPFASVDIIFTAKGRPKPRFFFPGMYEGTMTVSEGANILLQLTAGNQNTPSLSPDMSSPNSAASKSLPGNQPHHSNCEAFLFLGLVGVDVFGLKKYLLESRSSHAASGPMLLNMMDMESVAAHCESCGMTTDQLVQVKDYLCTHIYRSEGSPIWTATHTSDKRIAAVPVGNRHLTISSWNKPHFVKVLQDKGVKFAAIELSPWWKARTELSRTFLKGFYTKVLPAMASILDDSGLIYLPNCIEIVHGVCMAWKKISQVFKIGFSKGQDVESLCSYGRKAAAKAIKKDTWSQLLCDDLEGGFSLKDLAKSNKGRELKGMFEEEYLIELGGGPFLILEKRPTPP